MTISLVTNAGTTSTSNASSLTTSAVTSSGSNLYSIGLSFTGAFSPDAPNSFKWGGSTGDAYTLEHTNAYAKYNKFGALTLLSPAIDTRTFYADWATTNDETACIGAIFSGVDQTTPIRTQSGNNYVTASGTGASPTATATTVSGDVVIGLACAGWNSSNGTRTINSSETEIQQTNSGYEVQGMAMTTAIGTSTSMTWTLSSSPTFGWGVILIVLRAASAGGAATVKTDSVSLTSSVNTVSVSQASLVNPTAVSLFNTVSNPSTQLSYYISASSVSLTSSVNNISNSLVNNVSPANISLTSSVQDTSTYLNKLLNVNSLSLAPTVEQPTTSSPATLKVASVAITSSVNQVSVNTGDAIKANTVSVTSSVEGPKLISGAVVIKPATVSNNLTLGSIRVSDASNVINNMFSNESFIQYFRQQTGLDSYTFNDLAKAYYKQASPTQLKQFNDMLLAAQKTNNFIGLAPIDWRNF